MDLQVDRNDLHRTRTVELDPLALGPDQARRRVDAFGLSANNVTYAVVGGMLQYWDLLPAETFLELLDDRADPAVGHIVSLTRGPA